MNNIILFDSDQWDRLLPLTFTRPVCELRTGILTIREKWEHHLKGTASYITQDYLSDKYRIQIEQNNLLINGALLPNDKILSLIKGLQRHEALLNGEQLLAARLDNTQFEQLVANEAIDELSGMDVSGLEGVIDMIDRPYDLFTKAEEELYKDFAVVTKGRLSAKLSSTNTLLGDDSKVFIEDTATVECAILNTSTGPIYIGNEATVMEGAMIRGGLALGDHSQVKMGAKLYGTNTIGPWCKVGGEIGNSVLLGYTNKGHDGYLGNSVLGEWCNLGADTNTSNLKNNYSEVKLWDYVERRFLKTGQQFCGLIMADHSKSGINTMFNTGTVIGVGCNIFGDGYPRNYIPSFSWGGSGGFSTNQIDKMVGVAEKVMLRRNISLSDVESTILKHIYLSTAEARVWESA